jgi:hypothetical protein
VVASAVTEMPVGAVQPQNVISPGRCFYLKVLPTTNIPYEIPGSAVDVL